MVSETLIAIFSDENSMTEHKILMVTRNITHLVIYSHIGSATSNYTIFGFCHETLNLLKFI